MREKKRQKDKKKKKKKKKRWTCRGILVAALICRLERLIFPGGR